MWSFLLVAQRTIWWHFHWLWTEWELERAVRWQQRVEAGKALKYFDSVPIAVCFRLWDSSASSRSHTTAIVAQHHYRTISFYWSRCHDSSNDVVALSTPDMTPCDRILLQFRLNEMLSIENYQNSPHFSARRISFNSSWSLMSWPIWRLWYDTIEILLPLSFFWLCLRCLFGSSILVIVVLAGSLGFLMIWSFIICSNVMWSTCLGFLALFGWKTICWRWLNSFLIVMLLKLKSEFVDVSIVNCVTSSFPLLRFCSHDVKHSWFLAAENANLSIDSILRKHVAHIFFGSKSSSFT